VFSSACCGGNFALVQALLNLAPRAALDPRNEALLNVAWRGHIRILKLLLQLGADPSKECERSPGWTSLYGAVVYDQMEACRVLIAHGASLYSPHGEGVRSCLDEVARMVSLDQASKQSRRAALLEAWAAGPHPSQVQRRGDERWARRWPLMSVVCGCRFRPLARAMAALKHAALGPGAALPPVVLDTPEKKTAYHRALVFSNDGLLRLIVSFL